MVGHGGGHQSPDADFVEADHYAEGKFDGISPKVWSGHGRSGAVTPCGQSVKVSNSTSNFVIAKYKTQSSGFIYFLYNGRKSFRSKQAR